MPVQAAPMEGGSDFLAISLISVMASPELKPAPGRR